MSEVRLVYCNHCKAVGPWQEIYAGPTSRRRSTEKSGGTVHYCPEHLGQFEEIIESFNRFPANGINPEDLLPPPSRTN